MFRDETKHTHRLRLANTVSTILFGCEERRGEGGGVEWRGKGGENVCGEREGQISQHMTVYGSDHYLTVSLPELLLQVRYHNTPRTWACRSTCGFQSES